MTTVLTLAAFLLICDLRLGFAYDNSPVILYNFSKDGTAWLDFDLLPTFLGGALLIAAFIMLRKTENVNLKPTRNLSAATFVLSLLTFAQTSGRYIVALNTSGESKLNPGIVADIAYSVLDLVVFALGIVALGAFVDLLEKKAVMNHSDKKAHELLFESDPYSFMYRTFCAVPILVRLIMIIASFDRSTLFSVILAVLYHGLCLFSAVSYALFLKKIKPLID